MKTHARSWIAGLLLLLVMSTIVLPGCRKKEKEEPVSEVEEKFKQDMKFLIGRLRDIDTMDSINEILRIGGPAMPFLIDELDNESFNVRAGCINAINFIAEKHYGHKGEFEYTKEGANAIAGPVRKKQIEAIRAWWEANKGTDGGAPDKRGSKSKKS